MFGCVSLVQSFIDIGKRCFRKKNEGDEDGAVRERGEREKQEAERKEEGERGRKNGVRRETEKGGKKERKKGGIVFAAVVYCHAE